MCPHKVNELGYPLDPQLNALESKLCILASSWRGSWGDPLKQEEIVREYHTTMEKLYSLGWDAVLDIDCELPDRLMPEEYLRRHPMPSSGEL
jgi:hypothetical protein